MTPDHPAYNGKRFCHGVGSTQYGQDVIIPYVLPCCKLGPSLCEHPAKDIRLDDWAYIASNYNTTSKLDHGYQRLVHNGCAFSPTSLPFIHVS